MALWPYSGGKACKVCRRTLDRRLRNPDWNCTRQFPDRIDSGNRNDYRLVGVDQAFLPLRLVESAFDGNFGHYHIHCHNIRLVPDRTDCYRAPSASFWLSEYMRFITQNTIHGSVNVRALRADK